VAPLHGPLYRTPEDTMRYIDKLNRWASYTPEEKGVLVAYASI
jgi:flavorubredoxin